MDSKKDIFSTREGKQDFIIALIVVVIFTVFIYQFVFSSSDEVADITAVESDVTQTEGQPNKDKESEQNFHYTSSSTNEATTIQIVDGYKSERTTAIVVSDIKKSTPNKAKISSKPIYNNNETILLYEAQKKRADSITNVEKEKSRSRLPIKDIVNETSIVTASEEIKNDTTTDKTLSCVIIVGVFKEAGNKAKVIAKLNALGHGHSEGILRENLSYVGVPVNCENAQVREKLLSELNKSFGIDAWVKKL